jgi:hypothetical protein
MSKNPVFLDPSRIRIRNEFEVKLLGKNGKI